MVDAAHESLSDFLTRRERELQTRINGLYGQLRPLEAELADVRKAKSAVSDRSAPKLPLGGDESTLLGTVIVDTAKRTVTVEHNTPYARMTMKQLVELALREHFPNGATANQLIDFFHNAWGRPDVVRSSLSPQLSRLKSEGRVDLKNGSVWVLLENKEAPAGGASESSSQEESRSVFD
jgi:hypothetical protein